MPPHAEGAPAARTRARRAAWLWRWHGRAGVAACLLLLMLAVTGLVLNHSDDLHLDERAVGWDWPYALYGPSAAGTWKGFDTGSGWVLQGGEDRLFLGTRAIGVCDGAIMGASELQQMLLIACERELLLLTPEGERIESMGISAGLPVPVAGIAIRDETVLVRAQGEWHRFDPDAMALAAAESTDMPMLRPGMPPAPLLSELGRASGWLHWERFLLDLHSGRLFGRAGVWIVDVGGVLSLLLAISGIVMWAARQRRSQRPSSRVASPMSK